MILLLSCKKNAWKWDNIKSNWLDQCNIPYIIVVGNNDLAQNDYIYNETSKVLEVSCDDSYDDLTYKVAHAIIILRNVFNVSYIIKIDDDVIVNISQLDSVISKLIDNKTQYAGKVCHYNGFVSDYGINKYIKSSNKKPLYISSVSYCGGPVYFLGRNAINILSHYMLSNYIKFEDVCVGNILNRYNVYPTKCNLYSDKKSDLENLNSVSWHDTYKIHPQNKIHSQNTNEIIILYPKGGGLGNLLFQHNVLYAFGKKFNCTTYIFKDYYEPTRPHITTYNKLFKHINYISQKDTDELISKNTFIEYNEDEYIYNDIEPIISNCKVSLIKGYFQSYKYFEPYIYEINTLLKNNEIETYNEMKTKYDNIKNTQPTSLETVCCHIRRGDYLNCGNYYIILPEKYYENALENFKNTDTTQYKIFVFAEDVNEIRDWNIWKKYNVHFIDDIPEPLPTVFLMSMCDHFIIANSSLSINGYYLNDKFLDDTQKIIAPSKWFGVDGPKYNMYDLVPSNAILIDF
jgi:hypothetical protein